MRPIVLALPLILLLPVGAAQAQANGSYQESCTDISQNGSTLSARCRRPNGQYSNTTIDLGRCRGQGVANSGGRLSCGGVSGSASPAGGDRFGGDRFGDGAPPRRRFDGGFGNGGDDQAGFGAPRPRYRRPPPPQDGYGYNQAPDDQDAYAPPPRRRPRYDPDQDY